jgi:hypothetical protein
MTRLLLLLMPRLCLICAVFVLLLRVLPYDTTSLEIAHAFIAAHDDCAAPCLLGITPTITTLEMAWQRLGDDLDDAQIVDAMSGSYLIEFTWSGEQSALIDGHIPGALYVQRNNAGEQIHTFSVQTTIRFDDLRTVLESESTNAGGFLWVDTRHHPALVYYSLTYVDESDVRTTIILQLSCPVSWMDYWNAQARITRSLDTSSDEHIPPNALIRACSR